MFFFVVERKTLVVFLPESVFPRHISVTCFCNYCFDCVCQVIATMFKQIHEHLIISSHSHI